MALLLELLELARLELPRELRQAEQWKALQGVPGEACGWDLPLEVVSPSPFIVFLSEGGPFKYEGGPYSNGDATGRGRSATSWVGQT